jgi:hypothetical protein
MVNMLQGMTLTQHNNTITSNTPGKKLTHQTSSILQRLKPRPMDNLLNKRKKGARRRHLKRMWRITL